MKMKKNKEEIGQDGIYRVKSLENGQMRKNVVIVVVAVVAVVVINIVLKKL